MQIPDFIDNSHPKTYEVLDHYLRTEPRTDFASGYFNLGGYGLLRESLAEVPGLRLQERIGRGLNCNSRLRTDRKQV